MVKAKKVYTIVDAVTGLYLVPRKVGGIVAVKGYALSRREHRVELSEKSGCQIIVCKHGEMCTDGDRWHDFRIAEVEVAQKIEESAVRRLKACEKKYGFPESVCGEDFSNFMPTAMGYTVPMVGIIGRRLYVAKFGSHTNHGHVRNENQVNALYRSYGFNAPESMVYEYDKGDGTKETVMLSAYVFGLRELRHAYENASVKVREKIRRNVLDAFPVDAVVGNYDAYTYANDNALCDQDGNVWHIDNGSGLSYRATGGRRDGWGMRDNPLKGADDIFSLATPGNLLNYEHELLSHFSAEEILNAFERFDFTEMARSVDMPANSAFLLFCGRTDRLVRGKGAQGVFRREIGRRRKAGARGILSLTLR